MENGMFFDSPIGKLWIEEDNERVVQISGLVSIKKERITPFLIGVCHELEEYFEGKRKTFTFPITLRGTEFQKMVWMALTKIPYGEVKSYKEIAKEIGKPKAFRAVGGACNKNPLLLAVPCHRVVGSNRDLTGFALGLDIKKALLELEYINKEKEN